MILMVISGYSTTNGHMHPFGDQGFRQKTISNQTFHIPTNNSKISGLENGNVGFGTTTSCRGNWRLAWIISSPRDQRPGPPCATCL